VTRTTHEAIDSPCECEHNNPDSLDARLFFTVVLAVAPAVTMDEAASLSRYHDREDASSMVTAGATANTTVKNSRAFRESGLLCSHSHGESIAPGDARAVGWGYRRWLQDTSKRKLADLLIFFAPPPFRFPRVHPRLTRRLINTSAPDEKNRVDCNF